MNVVNYKDQIPYEVANRPVTDMFLLNLILSDLFLILNMSNSLMWGIHIAQFSQYRPGDKLI